MQPATPVFAPGGNSGPLKRLGLLAFLLGVLASPAPPLKAAERVSVAAASDLVFCLNDLAHSFTNSHPGVPLQITTGSSGNFFAQIQRGGPFDVFLSADMNYARALVTNHLADASSLSMYAIGRVVLWTTRPGVQIDRGLHCLTNPVVKRVAIANPEHAPYGRAAREALQAAGLWDAIRSKIVLGDNVSQTAQFVETGNADAGIVALSLVSSPRLKNLGRWRLVPENLHDRLEQGLVLTRRGAANPAARLFTDHLRSPKARMVFELHGFRIPDADAEAAPR